MTKTEWIEELLTERAPSLAALHGALTSSLDSTPDAARAVATVRYLATELLVTAQAAAETLTGKPAMLFDEAFIRDWRGLEPCGGTPI
ncbi:MAG: hypothetical protein KDA48_17435 [Amphiplicatus sp.]|nr:hypothetical protein [Amphiplicatus sp.]